MSEHKNWDEVKYRHDMHIEKAHLELGILIEELIEERDQWKNRVIRLLEHLYCNHPDCYKYDKCLGGCMELEDECRNALE